VFPDALWRKYHTETESLFLNTASQKKNSPDNTLPVEQVGKAQKDDKKIQNFFCHKICREKVMMQFEFSICVKVE